MFVAMILSLDPIRSGKLHSFIWHLGEHFLGLSPVLDYFFCLLTQDSLVLQFLINTNTVNIGICSVAVTFVVI